MTTKKTSSNRIWHRKSTMAEKIEWLLKNQNLWEGGGHGDERTRDIIEKMREDGLISKFTYWKDLKLWDWVVEARKLRRMTSTQPRAEISEEWVKDDRPIPTADKPLWAYQEQLKAKKKRKKR